MPAIPPSLESKRDEPWPPRGHGDGRFAGPAGSSLTQIEALIDWIQCADKVVQFSARLPCVPGCEITIFVIIGSRPAEFDH